MAIAGLRVRGILDSRAQPTVEAEVVLTDGTVGRGSCPRAITPGRRERPIGAAAGLGVMTDLAARLAGVLTGARGQTEVDARLAHELPDLGVSPVLAVSVAYARAVAVSAGVPLWRQLSTTAGCSASLPRLLVNVFSGGIHERGPAHGYQQVMAIPRTGGLISDIAVACRVWDTAFALATRRFGEPRLSASSGLLIPLDSAGQLELLDLAIAEAGLTGEVEVGIDVAAEHLRDGDRYRLAGSRLTSAELSGVLREQSARFRIGYLEDPFDPADEDAWRALRADLPPSTRVIGDDLFATDARRIEAGLADGILLKPSQIGTVSGLVAAAVRARQAGLALAVSHRSGETDDTVICDIASALGADLIKVGGPRRGDRLAKYNQLLRLAEEMPDRNTSTHVREPA